MKNKMQKRDYKKDIEFLESDIKWNENRKNEIKSEVLSNLDGNTILNYRKKKSRLRRLYISIPTIMAVLLLLLLGTAYVSPAFADRIFRVPVIGKLVEENSNLYKIQKGLDKEEYQYDSLYISYQKKSVEITLPEEEYDSKELVKELTEDILGEENVDGFNVSIAKVEVQEEYEVLGNVDDSQMKALDQFSVEIVDVLNKNNLSDLILSSGSSYSDKGKLIVEYSVYDTVEESNIYEIKDLTQKVSKTTGVEIEEIKIDRVSQKKQEQDRQWERITGFLGDKLMSNSSYQVVGVAYSVYPTIELTIKTSVESKKDPETQKFINDLEKEIRQAIEDSEKVQEDYQVIIKDKNHHRIN